MELARLLYKDGFSLVLVSRDVGSLQDLKDSLETEATMSSVTEGLQGRLGSRAGPGSNSEREGEDAREGENRDDNQDSRGGDEDYEDNNASTRRYTHPQSHSHAQQSLITSSSSSSPIADTGAAIESTTAGKQQQKLSTAKVSSSSSSPRRRHSNRRNSRSSDFDGRVTHAPQQPSTSTPGAPTSPDSDAVDAPQSSILQRPPPPPRQEIVLIPADLSSR